MTTFLLEYMNAVFSWRPKRNYLFLAALMVTLVSSTWMALTLHRGELVTEKPPIAQESVVVSRLNELLSEFKTLKSSVDKPMPALNLDAVTEQIAQISRRLERVSEADAKQLSETLTHTETTLSHELQSLKTAVTQLKKQNPAITYLPVKNLPFTIQSIDSIQQLAVASVAYDYKTVPLEKGDALGGWKVIALDYGKQRIELENARAERIVVAHENIG